MLKKSGTTSGNMTRWITIVMGLSVLMLAVGLLLFNMGILGLSERNVMADVKAKLSAEGADPGEMQYMTSQGETLFAVLAYPEDRAGCTYYLYVNRPGFDFGWHFESSAPLGSGITLAETEASGAAWLSANAEGEIASVTYADGTGRDLKGYPLVDTAGELHLFNAQGEEIAALDTAG